MLAEPAASTLDSSDESRQPSASLPNKTWILFLLIVVLSALPYLQALSFGFVYDDDAQILQNSHLSSWQILPSFFTQQSWHFLNPSVAHGYYRPVFLLWLALNYRLFGLHAAGWHFASILLHAIISALILLLLRRQGFPPCIALIAALFFGLHPAHIESVVWISGVTDPLACLFLLLSLLSWLRARDTRSFRSYGGALLCFFLATLAKETAAVFPLVILVYAWASAHDPRARSDRPRPLTWALLRALPFFITAGIYLALRHFALGAPFAPSNPLSLRFILAAAPGLASFYLRHLLWPSHLSLFYDFVPSQTLAFRSFWVPLLLVAAVLCVLFWLFHRWQDFSGFSALAWLTFPLLPVLTLSLLPKDDLLHDRYLYLPSVGAVLLLAALLRSFFPRRPLPVPLLLSFTAGLGLMALSVRAQSLPWRDNFSLYSHSCAIAPNNTNAQVNLAVVLLEQKQYGPASNLLLHLLQHDPNLWSANYNFGLAAYHQADYATAETYLRRSIALDSSRPDQFFYLGMTCLHRRNFVEADSLFRHAILLDPDADNYHLALGSVLMEQHNFREACGEFRQALRLNPNLAAAVTLLSSCEKHLQSGQ